MLNCQDSKENMFKNYPLAMTLSRNKFHFTSLAIFVYKWKSHWFLRIKKKCTPNKFLKKCLPSYHLQKNMSSSDCWGQAILSSKSYVESCQRKRIRASEVLEPLSWFRTWWIFITFHQDKKETGRRRSLDEINWNIPLQDCFFPLKHRWDCFGWIKTCLEEPIKHISKIKQNIISFYDVSLQIALPIAAPSSTLLYLTNSSDG